MYHDSIHLASLINTPYSKMAAILVLLFTCKLALAASFFLDFLELKECIPLNEANKQNNTKMAAILE